MHFYYIVVFSSCVQASVVISFAATSSSILVISGYFMYLNVTRLQLFRSCCLVWLIVSQLKAKANRFPAFLVPGA